MYRTDRAERVVPGFSVDFGLGVNTGESWTFWDRICLTTEHTILHSCPSRTALFLPSVASNDQYIRIPARSHAKSCIFTILGTNGEWQAGGGCGLVDLELLTIEVL